MVIVFYSLNRGEDVMTEIGRDILRYSLPNPPNFTNPCNQNDVIF